MKLVIDLQGAQNDSRWRGIGRYSLALAQAMAKNRGAHEVIIVLNEAFPETILPIRQAFGQQLPQENIRVWSAPGPTYSGEPSNKERRKRAEFVYESFLASLSPDLIHVSSLFEGFTDPTVATVHGIGFGIPTAVTLYDLIPLHDAKGDLQLGPPSDTQYGDRLAAFARADLLLGISEFSVQDASRYFGEDGKHMVNISSACSEIFKPSSMSTNNRIALRKRLKLDRKFIVTSGTVERRKNVAALIRAFSKLPERTRKNHQIVVVGSAREEDKAKLTKIAQSEGLRSDELVTTGFVTDEELIALYSDAALMVFPSIDEGFGLPPLEAMSCGTPTVASRAASLPEVIGLDEALFDPFDEHALSDLIVRGLEDEAFREILLSNAKTQAQKFSWDKSAVRAFSAMEALLENRAKVNLTEKTALDRCLQAISTTPPINDEATELAKSLARNFPHPNQPRQLLLDISTLQMGDASDVYKKAAQAILQEWLKSPPDGLVVKPVYANTDRLGYRYAPACDVQIQGERTAHSGEVIDVKQGDIFFGLDFAPDVIAYQKPWLQEARRWGVEVRFLVHDLLYLKYPQYVSQDVRTNFMQWLDIVSSCDGVIGTSHSTINTLLEWRSGKEIYDDAGFRTDVVYLGANDEKLATKVDMPSDIRSLLHTTKGSTCLLIGSQIEPINNHAQALSAFEQLWAGGSKAILVILGSEGWGGQKMATQLRAHPELGRRLFWLSDCPNAFRKKVYAVADCILAMSVSEDCCDSTLFEAAQAKVPILARSTAGNREVAGNNASYFYGETPTALAQAIQQWINHNKSKRTIGSKDMCWITWSECANRIAGILLSRERPARNLSSDVSVGNGY